MSQDTLHEEQRPDSPTQSKQFCDSGNEKLPKNFLTGRNVRQTQALSVGAFCLDHVGGKKRERERERETKDRQREIRVVAITVIAEDSVW